MVKTCTKCGEEKDVEEFSPLVHGRLGRASRCKACVAAYKRSRQAEDPEYYRRGNVRQKHGITLDEYDALMAEPCAICGAESQHLDHDHISGEIRKALCRHCNLMLGHSSDSPAVLRGAADYLEAHALDSRDILVVKAQPSKGG